MRILFALNQNHEKTIEEDILKYYNNITGTTFDYVKEYDLVGVSKRLKLEKFDLLILNEELERDSFVSTSFLDDITDKFSDFRVILIVNSEHEQDNYIKRLFNLGIYDLLYSEDISLENIVSLVIRGRTKAEAKIYLDLHDINDVVIEKELNYIPEEELFRIIEYFDSIEENMIEQVFEHICSQYSNTQILFLIDRLPEKIVSFLLEIGNMKFKSFWTEYGKLESNKINETKKELSKGKSVIEKEKIIPIEVEKIVYKGFSKKTFLVANLSAKSGSSFFTINLAKALAEEGLFVSVVEPPLGLPYIFDTIGIDLRLERKEEGKSLEFCSFPHIINEGDLLFKEKETVEDGIAWIITDTRRPLIREWDYFKMIKLINSSKSADISIVDVGNNIQHDSITPLINEVDNIFIMIDPMPAEIMQHSDLLDYFLKLKNNGVPISFIINKWTESVDKKQLLKFLTNKPLGFIPYVDLKYIHKAVYDCKIPYSIEEVKQVLEMPFYNIIKQVVPIELIDKNKKPKQTLLKKFFPRHFNRRVVK